MNCEELRILLPEYIDGLLDEPTSGVVRSHLENCSACREQHSELSSFLDFTTSLSGVNPPQGMKAEFMEMMEVEMTPRQGRIIAIPAWLKVAGSPPFRPGCPSGQPGSLVVAVCWKR